VEATELLLWVGVALGGYLLGSFNTVMVYRIPREIPLGLFSHQRSRCTSCNKVIPWHHNVPIFGFLFLKGRCGQCQAVILSRYLWVELSTLIGFLVTFGIFNHTTELFGLEYGLELAKLLFFTLALVATIFIDIEFRIIPDRFSIGCWIVALLAAVLWGEPHWISSLAGAAMGFGMFFLLAWGYEKWKGVEGLGFGDVKMMGWIGAWVGFEAVPFVVLSASITGLVAGLWSMRKSGEGMKTAIPFGPFLAVGAYAAWVLRALGYWDLKL
jgi:leader peptidase (prepilin peptidase)/N-methyltransferase